MSNTPKLIAKQSALVIALATATTLAIMSCSEGSRSVGSGKKSINVTPPDSGDAGNAPDSGNATEAGEAGDAPDTTGTAWNRTLVNFNLDWKYFQGAADGSETVAADDSTWGYVDLPHTTKFVTPEDPNALTGVYWYRKHFTVAETYHGRKVTVEFGAAMQLAEVWVNGVHKVRHEGGYMPFSVDITDAILYGERPNVIAVKLNHNVGATWPPGMTLVDFQYHGGLYRDVRLVVTDRMHITDAVDANKVASGGVFVTYPAVSSSSATLRIQTNVKNESKVTRTATLTSDLFDSTGAKVGTTTGEVAIEAGTDADIVQELTLTDPKLWHPNSPNLYRLDSTLANSKVPIDQTSTRIGIRSIAWSRDGGLAINGARFLANGVNLHQETYGLGNAVPNSAIYYDVKRIKTGGMDYIRGSHYPHAPAFYAACDELGVLVLNAQTGWQNFVNSDAFKSSTYRELREMIRRDRNHPSVVAWEASLNESEFTDAWALAAHTIVHEEYPGDQAYSAAWKWNRADIALGATQAGVRTATTLRPIIISEYGDWEYGGDKSTTRQAREAGDVAMLVQANNVQDAKSKNMALPWFSADGYWDFADYAGFNNYGITRSGLVDMYRLPKFAYYFLQSQRNPTLDLVGIDSGPMVFIANHWTATSPTKVRVYSNCEQVSLSLDDALVEIRSPDTGTNLVHPPFNFELGSFTPGTLRADCLIGGEKRLSHSRATPGAAASIRLRPEASTLVADASDARLVFIDVVDVNGTVVPNDLSQIALSVTGPGSIVGPGTVTMKGGQLATWIRAGRVSGTITVTAIATELAPASLELTTQEVPSLPPIPGDRGGS